MSAYSIRFMHVQYLFRVNRFNAIEMMPGVFFDLQRAASGYENPDGFPAAGPVHLEPAEEPLVLLVRPSPRVELDPMPPFLSEPARGFTERP